MDKLVAKIAVSAATYQIDKPYDYIVPENFADGILPGMRVIVPFSKGNRKTEGIVLDLFKTSDYEKLKCVFSVLDEKPVISEELIKLSLWMREHFFCTVYDAVKAMLPAGLWYNLSAVCRIAEGIGKDAAYEAVGRSDKQRKVLDIVYAQGGKSEYRDIELAFGTEDPLTAIRGLSAKGIVVTDCLESRRIKDKTVSFASLAVPSENAAETVAAKKRSSPSQSAVLELLVNFGGATINDIHYLTGAGNAVIKRLEQDGLIVIDQIEVFRRPEYREGKKLSLPELSDQQKEAFDGISSLTNGESSSCSLLYGITGSGKTAVYIHLIDTLLKKDKSSILLVPEIALTPQMLETFSSYFGDEIAVMHSSLSAGERYDEWKRIRDGAARVVVGTRSAVFAPGRNLGLIIIDEEQEDTYKSENAPRYHARDIAKFRCAHSNAALLLGSATPDVVTRYNAQMGKYSFFSLSERYNRMSLPLVEIVDMKKELRNGNGGDLSSVLIKELEDNIKKGEQSILFSIEDGASS